MELLITILAASSMITLMQQTKWYETLRLDFKPFNCTMCFANWASIGPWCYAYGWYGILLAALTGIVAELIDRKLGQY